ncbi:uncharacterized protein EV422DRAFT_505167 [Fimicolochytrium jonesii]|uniref:uncharacterized protein n=1 Tax=Fimicolochytrium jonesii TaxID=1396493 RepID=UPI0022FEAEC6|nr:uncharacterized protein EV422DRAFT_505167 [Fimicolochytrium jonesii]KAI8823141.1 hypothetical protein EV422DRAFT_505167 [Fimicolochytrium jonesii]
MADDISTDDSGNFTCTPESLAEAIATAHLADESASSDNQYSAFHAFIPFLHVFALALLLDRFWMLKNRQTQIFFYVSVVSNIAYAIWTVVGYQVLWFWTFEGTALYYIGRALTWTTFQQSVTYLNYLRIADTLERLHAPWVRRISLIFVFAITPLTLINAGEVVVYFIVTKSDSAFQYGQPLRYVAWLYSSAVDIAIGTYIVRMMVANASGVTTATTTSDGKKPLLRMHHIYTISTICRILLFLTCEYSFLIAEDIVADYTSMRSFFKWDMSLGLSVFKPYLLITDMARIRALGDGEPVQYGTQAEYSEPRKSRVMRSEVRSEVDQIMEMEEDGGLDTAALKP